MLLHLPRSPIPVFPLPGVYLFPSQLLPLHVFEPRYRQMIEDMLDGPGLLVVASPLASDEVPPPLPRVAGLGEIVRHERQPDGRFLVQVLGRARVQLTEVPSDRLYRRVICAPFAEIDVAVDDVPRLAQRLRAATSARLTAPLPLPESAPVALLADLLLQTLGASPDVIARAYAEPSVAARAHFVLRAAERGGPQAPGPE